MKAGRILRVTAALVFLAALGAGIWRVRQAQAAADVALAPARKGEFVVIIRCRGELKARRSVQLITPVIQNLRIVWMAPSGEAVKKGDPVIRFDPSTVQQQLQEKEAGLRQAQATLDQAMAQARITAEQDKLDMATAKYELERATLEASKAEIVSAMKGEESRIDLGLAQQKLRVQESTNSLHDASSKARIASLTRVRDQAQAEVNLEKRRLAMMELRAPLSGVVVYMTNYSQGWNNASPFKVGDTPWPGSALAEIPDLGTLQMEAKIEETDRGRIAPGQPSNVRVDALPEKTFATRLSAISTMTEQNFEWPPSKNFRAYADVSGPDSVNLRPSMTGHLDVIVNRIPGAISVPVKALFTRNGRPIVYVAKGTRYQVREVELLARNPDEVAIKGINEGDRVALAEPPMEPAP